jgi:hypothetical protein
MFRYSGEELLMDIAKNMEQGWRQKIKGLNSARRLFNPYLSGAIRVYRRA